MRGLIMDFGSDPQVKNIVDQYMFGPAFLVAPIYEYKARSRDVYLPMGHDWYDFYNGAKLSGGQTIKAASPYERMPLFVKAGSIIPTGPDIQYVDEKPGAPLTLNVYTGADGKYELYEDDGKTYEYEKGAWSSIPLHYQEATQTLTIGDRTGGFNGMSRKRTFNIRWLDSKGESAADVTAKPDATVEYVGKLLTLQKPR